MRYFHLTILREPRTVDHPSYETIYDAGSSIEHFLAIEKELGRNTHVIYSRELTEEEYRNAKNMGL